MIEDRNYTLVELSDLVSKLRTELLLSDDIELSGEQTTHFLTGLAYLELASLQFKIGAKR